MQLSDIAADIKKDTASNSTVPVIAETTKPTTVSRTGVTFLGNRSVEEAVNDGVDYCTQKINFADKERLMYLTV